jgi:hypothetical protein
MTDSAAFEAACARLEESGALDRLAARGTIRLVLKAAGLEPKGVTARELVVAVERLLPAELSARGVPEPQVLSASIAKALESVVEDRASDTPEAVFARLGTS